MIGSISPDELKARLDNGDELVVIDVRMPWELEVSSVDFSENIVLNEIPSRLEDIPKDKTLIFMCRSGARSMKACEFLAGQGWDESRLLNLEGGILAWARDVDPSLPENY